MAQQQHFISFAINNNNNLMFYLNEQSPLNHTLLDIQDNAIDLFPKDFTISTNNGSYKFNIEILKDTSSVISKEILDDPQKTHFHIDINDENNVMKKIELLYQGKKVTFNDNELLFTRKFSEILNITTFPSIMQPYNQNALHMNRSFGKLVKHTYEVTIRRSSLITFLQQKIFQTFTIVTKNQEYECNIYGIHSSKKLNELIQSNPTLRRFNYDIDDDDKEFQLICDIFNFESIQITNNNMESLHKFAEDLQIDSILTKIDHFINNYQKAIDQIDDKQRIIDQVDQIFDLLYNRDLLSVDDCKSMIIKAEWASSEERVLELSACFLSVMQADFKNHEFLIDLLISLDKESVNHPHLKILIQSIIKKLMDDFASVRINCALIYKLHKKNFISKEKIQKKITKVFNISLFNDEHKDAPAKMKLSNTFVWFLPEILEMKKLHIENKMSNLPNQFSSYIRFYYPNKIEEYKKMRDSGEPEDPITKAIFHNDRDSLQSILSKFSDFSHLSMKIPLNIFDPPFLDSAIKDISYINYAAAYGSLECFKYLVLNDANIDSNTLKFAVFGGNTEIIRYVDQYYNENQISINLYFTEKKRSFGKNNLNPDIYKNPILPAIENHQNKLFDWILQEKYINNNITGMELSYLIKYSARFGNVYSVICCIDNGVDLNSMSSIDLIEAINCSSSRGFLRFVYLILSIIKNIKIINQNNLTQSIASGNVAIFKLILSACSTTIEEFDEQLFTAIKTKQTSIIKYIVEKLFDDQIKLSKSGLINCLSTAIVENPKMFCYLFEKLGFERMMNQFHLNGDDFITILCDSLDKRINFENIKFVTDLILNEFKGTFFTTPFIKATSNKLFDICHFFIEKKVPLNVYSLSKEASNLGNIDEQTLNLLIKDLNQELKQVIFTSLLHPAINKKNVKIVEFLLKQDIPYENALYQAVLSNDLETVKVVLNHDNSPYFINQVFEKGTALIEAVLSKNKEIVKLLLSIDGIDPNLYVFEKSTPLITAITSFNIEMINIFLDYYGENIQSQMWQLNEAIKRILSKLSSEKKDLNPIGQHNQVRLRNLPAVQPGRFGGLRPNQAPQGMLRQGALGLGNRHGIQEAIKSKVGPSAVFNVVKRLMDIENIDLNCSTNDCTLLIYACNVNHKDLAKMLIESNKVDVNLYESKNGNTPLMVAIEKQNEEVAELLINFPQTNINKVNYNKETALTIAVSKQNSRIISLLLKSPKFNRIESRLDYAFYISSGEEVINLLYSIDGLDVNYKQMIYKSSLIYAVEKKDITKIQMIVNHKTFNRNKSLVTTALFEATKTNDVSIFREILPLVDNDVNIMLVENESLLTYSAMNQAPNIITEILNQENFDAKKSDIITAFVNTFHINIDDDEHIRIDVDITADYNSMQMIYNYDQQHDHLIDFSNLLPNGKSFFTSINFPFINISDFVNFFIRNGVDPDKPDHDGVYPLQHAIQNVKSVSFVRLLLETNKIDLNRKLKISEQLRASSFNIDKSKFLSKKDYYNSKLFHSKPMFTSDVTYLHLAAQIIANQEIFYILKNLNVIDINAEDSCGETPLFYAVRCCNTPLIQNLFMIDDLDYKHQNKNKQDVLKVANKSQLTKQDELFANTKGDYLAKLISILGTNSKFN